MTKVKPHLAINSASIFRDPTIIDTGNLVGRKKKKKKIKLLCHLQPQQEIHGLSKQGEREESNEETLYKGMRRF